MTPLILFQDAKIRNFILIFVLNWIEAQSTNILDQRYTLIK